VEVESVAPDVGNGLVLQRFKQGDMLEREDDGRISASRFELKYSDLFFLQSRVVGIDYKSDVSLEP
jgi:hypothetical protein